MKRKIMIVAALLMLLLVTGIVIARSLDTHCYAKCIKDGGSETSCEMKCTY
jgi:uncharacterized membrane-anchored protein